MINPFDSLWSNPAKIISGGKSKRVKKSKKCKRMTITRGGRGSAKIIGAAISTALVPFGLFASQKQFQSSNHTIKRSPKRSSKRSPKRSSKRSPKRSPTRSSKISSKRSSKRSPTRSSKKSSKR